MDDTNNQKLEWRLLDAPIPPEVWFTGHWLWEYGTHGPFEPDEIWRRCTNPGERWAPCHADGSPRPWPEVASQAGTVEAEIAALRADNHRLRVKIACLSDLANLAASESQSDRESEVHTAHALVYLHVARAVPADRDYWLRLARESRDHAREARKEERLPAF